MLQRRVTPGADEQTRRRQLCGEGAVTVLQAIALKQVERALDGDARACAFVRECTGGEGAGAGKMPRPRWRRSCACWRSRAMTADLLTDPERYLQRFGRIRRKDGAVVPFHFNPPSGGCIRRCSACGGRGGRCASSS